MDSDRPELNVTGDGELTTDNVEETIRHLEEDLDEEREKRWSFEYKLNQVKKKLRKHGVSIDDLIDGRVDPRANV